MDITKLALQNSKTLSVTRFVFACLGVLMLFSIAREQYPNVPLYYVHVLVPYPGASAIEIEEEITQKVEREIKELPNISSVSSLISDGLSFTRVAYSQSISKRQFKNSFLELQSIINNIEFPSNAKVPIVDNFTYLDFMPIISVVVYNDEDSEEALGTLMESSNIIKSNLEFVKNVQRISNRGLLEKKINIALDNKELINKQLSLFEIFQSIQYNDQNIPAGDIHTSTSSINTYTESNIEDIDSLNDIIIRYPRTSNQDIIYLKDIANIDYHYDQNNIKIKYNGNNSVILDVYKVENSDSISIVKSVKDQLSQLQERMPDGVRINTIADSTVKIHDSITVLVSNAIMGFILLCISLLLFLGWKPAIISAMEIPFTFATSFFILKLFGITINTSTLFALVLVLGMIVDHSIVILENIIRLQHFHKLNRLDSIAQGVREVEAPVISSTLTTIGSFLPLAFMPGLIGKFLLPVPITIVVTLVISTISALFIIPIYYMSMPGKDKTHELRFFEWSRKVFGILLKKLLPARAIVCVISLLAVGVSIWFLFHVPVSLYDTEEEAYFFIDVTLPSGSNISESNKVISKMEEILLPLIDENKITSIVSAIGDTNIDEAEGIRFDKPHNAQLQIEVNLVDKNDPVESLNVIIAEVKEKVEQVEGEYSLRIRKQRTGPPVSSAVEFRILSDNFTTLDTIDTRIRTELAEYSELYNIKSNLLDEKPTYLIKIDEEKAAQLGLSVASIGLMIRQWLSNDAITELFYHNKNTKVVANITNISDDALSKLKYIFFPNPQGGAMIPFDEVASLELNQELSSIYREEGKRMLKVTASAHSRDRIKQINTDIEELYNTSLSREFPDAMFQVGGEFDEFASLLNDILLLLLIGLFVVYIILVSEFKSYLQPILIMLTIVFTTIGVSAYLFLSKSSLSITVLYSFVALVGVVVNGSIVLVSTANNLIKTENLNHLQAIEKASLQRFKPIFLTSFTTICGILPTALGLNGQSPIWQPMAATIAVGLIFSTFTTLIIIPSFYAILKPSKF